jgi:putative transposase
MKTSRFTDEQRVRILREADKTPVREVIKKHAISEPTFYAWRRKFGGMDIAEAKKLRALEAENGRLKKLLAESQLENSILKEVAAKDSMKWPGVLSRTEASTWSTSRSISVPRSLRFAFADQTAASSTRRSSQHERLQRTSAGDRRAA